MAFGGGEALAAPEGLAQAFDQVLVTTERGQVGGRLHSDVEEGSNDRGLSDCPSAPLPGLPAFIIEPIEMTLFEEDG